MILNDAVKLFAQGIAIAEGFFVTGSRPQRNNNPGDLTVDTTGTGIGKDGPFIVYATETDGWEALYKQVEMMFTNASRIYNSNMTIRQIAEKYTTTDQLAWAQNVARTLGISIDTPISTLITVSTATVGTGILLLVAALWLMMKEKK